MLTDLVKEDFEAGVRRRGEAYAAAGHVERLSIRKDYLTSEVHGSEIYDVSVEIERKPGCWDLLALCTCPYAESAPCKHIWATLVKARERVASKWGALPRRIRFYFDVDDFAAGDDDDDYNGYISVGSGRSVRPPARAARAPKLPAWELFLDSAPTYIQPAERIAPLAEIGPLRYILDTERSRLNRAMTLALAQDEDRAGRPRRIAINSSIVPRMSDERDRTICAMLVGTGRRGRESEYSLRGLDRSDSASSLWQLDHGLFPLIIPMLFETGRFYWTPSEKDPPRPLRHEREQWELSFVIDPGATGPAGIGSRKEGENQKKSYVLRAGLTRGSESAPLENFDGVFEGHPGLALRDDALAPLQMSVGSGCLSWLKHQKPVEVSPGDVLPLVRKLHARGLHIPIRWPEEWSVRARDDIAPRPRLSVKTLDARNAPAATLEAKLSFLYGDDVIAEHDGGQYLEAPADSDGASPTLIRRRFEGELAAAAKLSDFGVKPDPYQPGRATFAAKRLSGIVAPLIDEGWEVRGEGGLFRPAGKIDIRVSTGIDWFDVEGEADFGGATAPIAELLAALKRGDRFITLGDGSQGMMPEEWLDRHAAWIRLGEANGDGVRFSRAQLSVIDALLAAMPEAVCDEQLAEARRKLAAFEGVRPVREPRAFHGELRPYQRIGLGWLKFLDDFGFGGCLADDMGLGKTVQVLAFLADRAAPRKRGDAGPWLLVAPRSLVFNWIRESERFAPSLRIADYTGPDRTSAEDSFSGSDVVVTTFGTLRRDIEWLREIEFAGVVLDEAQAIKNPGSQVAKAARLLRARRRLALTGTPIENSLDDLWSIFEFLNPGMLGSAKAFSLIARSASGSAESADLALLRRALRPFILRRTKREVAPELPERTEQTISCELVGRQRTLYDSLRKHYRDQLLGRIDSEGMNKSRMHVLEALLRLRQAACHPRLIEPKASRSSSGKVATLLDMLAEIASEGNKALVFSQFTSMLDLVEKELDARRLTYERLDGQTSAKERARRVDRFQADGACPIFLISLKAGGVGLNLTAAQYVFLLDPWWNPAVEAQAIDRTHRIGQDRHVSAYRLIAKGTVEERILELQATKRELADAIVGGQERGLKALSREDLEWLLG
jgi:superfamily II DNA or RNA helicase